MTQYAHVGNKAEQYEVVRYLAYLRDVLGLGNFRILVLDQPAPEGVMGAVWVPSESATTRLKLGAMWHSLNTVSKTETLIHEMLHLVCQRAHRHVDEDSGWEDVEYVIEQLATSYAKVLAPFGDPATYGRKREGIFLVPAEDAPWVAGGE